MLCVTTYVWNFEPFCKSSTIQYVLLSFGLITFCIFCKASHRVFIESFHFVERFLRLENYLVVLVRYLVYKFLRPAATFNLTPYSMLCNLNFLSGVIYTSLPIFTSLRIARVNTALLAHNPRDGTWQTLYYLSLCECAESAPSLRWEYC